MTVTKFLGIALVLVLTVSLLGSSAVFASDRLVDETAKIDLVGMHGKTGTAELRLRIGEDGMLDTFRVKAEGEGIMPGKTVSLVVYGVLLATDTVDDNGTVSFDVTTTAHPFELLYTLVGVKVHIVKGDMLDGKVLLWGKVMEGDLVDSVLD